MIYTLITVLLAIPLFGCSSQIQYVWDSEYVLTSTDPHVESYVPIITIKLPGIQILKGEYSSEKLIKIASVETNIVKYNKNKDLCLTNPPKGYLCSPNYVLTASKYSDALRSIRYPKSIKYLNKTKKTTVIGVLDTGIDCTHPMLKGSCVDGYNAIIDKEGLQYTMDDNGHGTHVAGIIAAHAKDGSVVGVCPTCKLIPIKFLTSAGSGSLYNAIKAINWATSKHIPILNNSWGGGSYSAPLHNAILKSSVANVSFIVSAGNENVNTDLTPVYPANYDSDNIISVASMSTDFTISPFSNHGNNITVGAPGESILSTYLNGTTAVLSGTSMAAPFVSGVLGSNYTNRPELGDLGVLKTSFKKRQSLSGYTFKGSTLNQYLFSRNCSVPLLTQCRSGCSTRKCKKSCLSNPTICTVYVPF